MSLWSRDEVPHIFARTSRLRPGEFLVTCAKRLLQQYLPGPDVSRCSNYRQLLDHLVGAVEQHWRHFEAERLGSFQVNHQFVFGRRLHRQVGRLLAP